MTEQIQNEGAYKKVASLVNEWLGLHKGERFDLDTICRQLALSERENRKYVAIELARKVEQGKLEKVSKVYSIIDSSCKYIDWVNASDEETVPIIWPYGRDDNSRFGFDSHAIINPGDIIVIAGVSNMGKTAFCINLLWENMDVFPCTLMGNEYTPVKFKRRVKRMDWASPVTKEGLPKFELIERRDRWQDIIRPDNINIIDWINLGDNFYQIGTIIEGIQSKLKSGVAVISLQKSKGKDLGLGGGFSEHLASLYLLVDFEKITVRKCKEWIEHNPNGEMYGFTIVNGGTKFSNIRTVTQCRKCSGTGRYKLGDCDECFGKGYIDKV